ncbi:hypothetical protein K7432_011480 [Basidiobolus ranarum]|uniref:Uncharacterized protein n=1 Tax=Basidiobolus ranarum TaxID=34480 RepID=A0ABR2WM61_9FUNG
MLLWSTRKTKFSYKGPNGQVEKSLTMRLAISVIICWGLTAAAAHPGSMLNTQLNRNLESTQQTSQSCIGAIDGLKQCIEPGVSPLWFECKGEIQLIQTCPMAEVCSMENELPICHPPIRDTVMEYIDTDKPTSFSESTDIEDFVIPAQNSPCTGNWLRCNNEGVSSAYVWCQNGGVSWNYCPGDLVCSRVGELPYCVSPTSIDHVPGSTGTNPGPLLQSCEDDMGKYLKCDNINEAPNYHECCMGIIKPETCYKGSFCGSYYGQLACLPDSMRPEENPMKSHNQY